MAQAVTAQQTREADGVKCSVVSPAFNEAANLKRLVEQLTVALDSADRCQPYEIIIVDDGSTDDTPTKIHHLAELFDSVRCIQLKRNYGQSHALQAGIDAASGEVVVTIDADLQNDPADIPRLVERLERDGVDCVSGRRTNRKDTLAKRIPSRIQTTLAKKTGPQVNDFGCTLKAYRRAALDDVCLYGEAHRYIPSMLHERGHAVTEMEVNHRPRENGSSHYGTGRLVRGFVDLVWHWFWVRYGTRPLHLFGGLGVMFMGLSGIIGAWLVVDRFVFGNPISPHLPMLLAAGIGILFGVILFVFGVLAEMLTKLHYRDETPYRIRRVFE